MLPATAAPLPLPDAPPAAWIPAAIAAEVLGLSDRAIRKRCAVAGPYAGAHRYVAAPGGGRRLEIAETALPPDVRARALELLARDVANNPSTGSGQALPARRVLTPEVVPTDQEIWDQARQADRDVASYRMAVLEGWRTFVAARATRRDRVALTLQFLQFWNATHPEEEALSRPTLGRWAKRFRERGRVGLLPQYTTVERDRVLPQYLEVVEPTREAQPTDELVTRFNRHYLTTRKLSVALCRELVRGELELANSPLAKQIPSPATYRRYVRTIPRDVLTAAREGMEAYERRCLPYLQRDYAEIPVMDMWVSDHMQHDVIIRWLDGRLLRPWLTAWMDVRSRRWVGWTISERPCQETVLASMRMGILRFGIPGSFYTDNGREYSVLTVAGHSRRVRVQHDEPRVRALTEHLGTPWHFSIPERPNSRGMIEGAFGTVHEGFDKLFPTYCGRSPEHKPADLEDRLKDPNQVVDSVRFALAFGRWAEAVYNVRPHTGEAMDGRSPRDVFESQPYQKRVVTPDVLRLLMMRSSKPLTIQQNGVWAFDRWWKSEALAHRLGERAYYRYALEDISELHLFTLQDQYLCTVVHRELTGGTAADHRAHEREKAERRRAVRGYLAQRDQVDGNVDSLEALIAARAAEAPGRGGAEAPENITGVTTIETALDAGAKAIQQGREEDARGEHRRALRGDPFDRLRLVSPAAPRERTAEEKLAAAEAKLDRFYGRD